MITERIFGEIKGIGIPEVTLHNAAGMEVSILAYGATVRSVLVPTASGKKVEVCLGYDSIEEYVENSGHFGGSIGRFANRIICTAGSTAGIPRSGTIPPIRKKTASLSPASPLTVKKAIRVKSMPRGNLP